MKSVGVFNASVNSCRLLTTYQTHQHMGFTIWLFNIAMENGPCIDDFPIKTSIYKGFSMAMLNE